MDFRDLDFRGWKDLATGMSVEGFTPKLLGKGAYGRTFEHPDDPNKVIKFQYGEKDTFTNEIEGLAEAYFNENTDVPRIHESGFHVDPSSEGASSGQYGSSYIVQDRRKFDGRDTNTSPETARKGEWRKAQALSRLYNQGISHNDTHGGNIVYDSKTDTPSILDFGLASRSERGSSNLLKADTVQKGLKYSGDTDAAAIYAGVLNDAYRSGDPEAVTDLVDQGQEVLEKSEFRPDMPNILDNDEKVVKKPYLGQGKSPKPIVLPSPKTPVTPYQTPKPKFNKGLTSALQGGLSVGASDLIPSRETVRTAYQQGPAAAVKRHAGEALQSLPYGVGTGLVVMAAPVTAPFAAGVGGALTLNAGAEAIDEVVTQQTGEGLMSKFRQTIGTEDRTGYASPNSSLEEQLKRDAALINNPPIITDNKRRTRSPVNDAPLPDVAHRLRLAGERFNPMKGEFGLSELIFGR